MMVLTAGLYGQKTQKKAPITGPVLDSARRAAILRTPTSPEMSLIAKKGLQKQYDGLREMLVNALLHKKQNTLAAYKELLNDSILSYSPAPFNIDDATWKLAYHGYTIEKLKELQKISGINLLDLSLRHSYDNDIIRHACLSELIITGTIDTMYNDTSYADGMVATITVKVKETLKGDPTIKNVIIRDGTGFITYNYRGERVFDSRRSHNPMRSLNMKMGKEFLFFLFKGIYDWQIVNMPSDRVVKTDSSAEKLRQFCFSLSSLSIPLQPIENLEAIQNQEKERERPKNIERVRALCQQLAEFFRTIPVKN